MSEFKLLRFQTASDIQRDGLGVEMIDAHDHVVAEVFRCDREKTVQLSLFVESLPFNAVALLMDEARIKLDPFEDGTPLADALD
ncbi:hypothetical protein [Botrimarina colliarenosi]|nr:hypothetical protein [Botrimarina colliarenosi]